MEKDDPKINKAQELSTKILKAFRKAVAKLNHDASQKPIS